jgi:hypothetical protein
MNQKTLIVFTVFLLITILLLLLWSDAKAKGSRIRLLVYISGNPPDAVILNNIRFLLEKIASEGSFVFTILNESNPGDFQSIDSNTITLQFQPHTLIKNEFNELQQFPANANSFQGSADDLGIPAGNSSPVWIDPASPHVIHIAAGPDAVRCNDPDFEMLVRDAILKVVSLKKNQ